MLRLGQHERAILSSVLMIAGLFSASPCGAEDLAGLQAEFLKGNYAAVADEVRRMERQGQTLEDGILYLWGVSSLKLNRTEEGRLALQRLLSEYPSGKWVPQARLALGQSWENEGRDEQALKVYQQFVGDQADGSYAAQGLLRLGRVQMRLGHLQEGRATLDAVVRKSPASAEASAAKDLLRQGTFYYCVQVGSFSAERNAERLAGELKRRGYASEVNEGTLQGKTFYRVRVGRFTSRDQAETEMNRLRSEGFPGRIFP